jgi:hypothetical protein
MLLKKIYSQFGVFIFTISILFVFGCASDNVVKVAYLMPAKTIKDTKAISILCISAKVNLSGNAVGAKDNKIIKSDVINRISDCLNSEGFYKTTDVLWGDNNGPHELQQLMLQKGFPHGYGNYSAAPVKAARLEVVLNASINRSKLIKRKTILLKYIPYKRGKGDYPTSYPNYAGTRIRKKTVSVDIYKANVKGNMNVKVYDINGKKVYEKNFYNLIANCKISPDKLSPIPVNSAIVSTMIMPSIKALVADISPHAEVKKIEINEDGNERAVILLKTLAFSEAIRVLDEIIDAKKVNTADLENMALTLEIIGDYHMSLDFWQQAYDQGESTKASEGIKRVKGMISGSKIVYRNKQLNAFKSKKNQDY